MRQPTIWTTPVLLVALCLSALGQSTDTKDTPAPATDMKGMPPRATPGDYQAKAQAGTLTIAAEFTGHSVPKPEGPLSTEDFVVVETGFFGAPGQRLMFSIEDFTLRLNGKKTPLASQPYGLVTRSLKDPQWSPPEEAGEKPKSKSGLSTGGQGSSDSLPVIVHVPIALQRAMAQYLQKASLPEGDRPLPAAGLIFFQYRGKTESLRSIELTYSGPAGKATLELQP